MKRYALATFITMLALTSAHAAKFYRHIPFSLAMKPGDSLVVNYDFSKKNGIRCTSDNSNFEINFVYKGRQKSSNLPVLLQNAHVPEKKHEELADNEGQYSLQTIENRESVVSCNYVESGS